MASKPPPYSSSGSVSRSQTSRDAMQAIADEMLRASLTHGGTSASAVSSLPALSPPSYHRTAEVRTPPQRNPAVPRARPAVLGGAISTRTLPDSLTLYGYSKDIDPESKSASVGGIGSSSSTISAADSKAKVREFQRKFQEVKAGIPQRSMEGLFKKACATDLLFLIDTTGSMWNYIKEAKQQVKNIVADIKEAFLNESEVRLAIVGYKDHGDSPNIQFLDFTPSTDSVFRFLDGLKATGGNDLPEDVLGGVKQAINATWKQQTRCIIHIADAPPHGRVLHDLDDSRDNYPTPGSEPHTLTHKPLIMQLIQFNVNYALLRINSYTDRMALTFAQLYTEAGADAKLHVSNKYSSQMNDKRSKGSNGLWSAASNKHADVQFEEQQLGTTYSQLRHLVVRSVTSSVTRTAGRLSKTVSSKPTSSVGGTTKMASELTSIREDGASGGSTKEVSLERDPPHWDTAGWLDETLEVEGFCPDMVLQSANSLNEMMSADENIKLSFTQLTIHARSKPFAEGSVRAASYARTAASTSKFVVKSFKEDGKMLVHLAEDMRIQALCKAFALEFNGLLKIEPPIDFIVTTCLQSKSKVGSNSGCLSLEPYIEGEYIKYNNNTMFVKEDSPDDPDPFNKIAQAFSHFTFERSWGHFLVNDLQGVGHLLTDPSIQTKDRERFNLSVTNLSDVGFKFFFVTHQCNTHCQELGLKSNREMIMSGVFEFREFWPTIEPTVCCSNKLCRRIVRLASTHESTSFPGYHWCDACWEQLQASMTRWICAAPGPNHEFDMSRFFYESQGQLPPRRCPEHREKDTSVPTAAVVGGNLWGRMKLGAPKREISGRSW